MLDLNNHFEMYTGETHAQWGEHREDYRFTAMEPGSAGSAKLKVIQGLQRAIWKRRLHSGLGHQKMQSRL